MSKACGKYTNERDWIRAVWHIRMERLAIANLLGDRPQERGELEFLETWSKHLNQEDQALQLLEARLRYLLDTGEISEAETAADRLVNSAKKAGDRSFLRRACGWRAVVYREQSRYPKAISDFETAESCTENELQRMEIWLDKGMTLVYANRYQEAEKMLQGAISIAQKYNDINSQGIAWNNLGICCGQQRKGLPAIEAYDRAIALYRQTGYKLGSAMACGNLSEIYLSRGQLDKALELSRQCQQLGAEAEDIISIGLGQDIEGRALAELGDDTGAADSFKKSLKVFCQVNDAVAQAMSGFYLVICLARSGNITEAEEFYRQLESLDYEDGRYGKGCHLAMARAAILLAGKHEGPAVELLERQLGHPFSQNQESGEIMLQLSVIYERQKESTKSREMLEGLQKIPGEKLTDLFKIRMYSSGWTLYSGMGLPAAA
ncbi:MAG: tetratricopeptide repeat protein, partial [Deltaproteobacteria bacterium]|nr:tetratricopeptide repeat protein [Deltaproteobacteria bacterium]